MKTISKVTALMLLLFSYAITAQNTRSPKHLFVRVYDINEMKISKGKILFANDSIVGLENQSKVVTIKVNSIGKIKTKRSTGTYIFTGALIGGITGVIVGAASSNEVTTTETHDYYIFGTGTTQQTHGTSPAEGAFIGLGVGSAAGALLGLGTSFLIKSKTYDISGEMKKWQFFLESENLKR